MTTQQVTHYVKSRTGKLALTYLVIIMAMTVIFSSIIYTVAVRQFDRPLMGRGGGRIGMVEPESFRVLLDQRAAEARAELLFSLLFLNLGMLGFGVWFSTYLALRTMKPIEHALDEQAQFVSNASHELRTPLTALSAMNEVVLRRKSNITDADARDLAQKNMEETAKLYSLTTSLLELVHADHDAPQVSRVDLQRAVGNAMEQVIAVAQAKEITVEDRVPNVTVLTQSNRLTQVIKVLLENAVKYSHAGGTVRISGKITNDSITLSVSDNGIGIAADDLPHIYNRFYRVEQSRSKDRNGGYGIGLAIAKAISDQMNMNLTVKSKLGKGSVFSVDLPLIKEE